MEMMVVMLVVAIVMALSAPMITKKTSGAGAGSCLWTSLTGGNIGFNANQDAVSAVIGGNNSEITAMGANVPKLTIATNGNYPQIGFLHSDIPVGTLNIINGQGIALGNYSVANKANAIAIGNNTNSLGNNTMTIGYGANARGNYSISIGTQSMSGNDTTEKDISIGYAAHTNDAGHAIAIGESANSARSYGGVAIGYMAKSENTYLGRGVAIGASCQANECATALGSSASATGSRTTAIGFSPSASGTGSVSIGYLTTANKTASVAIGYATTAKHNNSIAIGYTATTTASNQIVLGNSKTSVYIPGKLIVGNYSFLGINVPNGTSSVWLQATKGTGSYGHGWVYDSEETGHAFENTKDFSLSTAMSYSSDKRLKDIIGENLDAMDKINRIKVYNYTFKKDDLKTPHVGVIAQELQKVFPNAVTKDENGYLQIRHEDMFFTMINALKELDAKIKQIAIQLADNIKIVASDSEKIRDLTIRVNNQDKEIKAQNKKLLSQEKEIAALKKEIADLRKIVNK